MNFNALIPYNNGTPQRQDTHSSLIRTGPGYLVALGLDQGGRLIDLVANFGYVGPDRRQKQIQDFFSEAEKREEALDKLHRARDSDSLETEHEKLLKYCCDLLKYALPKYVLLQSRSVSRALINCQKRIPNAAHDLQDSC